MWVVNSMLTLIYWKYVSVSVYQNPFVKELLCNMNAFHLGSQQALSITPHAPQLLLVARPTEYPQNKVFKPCPPGERLASFR